jgi:hypothetical protein
MAVQRSHPSAPRWSLAELTVTHAHADLLEIEPLDLGPGAPASAALAEERDAETPPGRDGQ